MKTIAYIIYMFLCGLVGVVCSKADIDLKDWKYWAILGSVIGAFYCGVAQ